MAKYMTASEAATANYKAVRLRHATGQEGRAAEFERMSLEQYAQHHGVTLMDNPKGRRLFMAREAGSTKGELADRMDEIEDLLEEALDPELTREELVARVKEIRDVATGEDEEEEEDETDDDSDLDDDSDEDNPLD